MKDFWEQALEKVGLVASDFGSKITIFGFRGVHIEGHKGIISYSNTCISVKIGRKKIEIKGSALSVKEITRDELFISGKINGTEVCDA